MRDDLDKLPLPKSAKKYARLKSSDLGSDWSKKVDTYMDMAADLTNQNKEGFKNKDASGKVKHAFKESVIRAVARLLGENDEDLLNQMGDVANSPMELYKLAREALNWSHGEGHDMVTAINAALETVGVVGVETHLHQSLAEYIQTALSDIDTGGEPEDSIQYISRGIDDAVPDLEPGSKWALMKIFSEEAHGIKAARENDEAEGGIPQQPENEIDAWDNEDEVQESVKAAAVKCHDGTVIAGPPGADHIAACMMANQQSKSWDDEGLGFVTDDDRFLTRDEAEIEGMAHGQLKPDISDPGMVHARDFNWNESFDRGYQYATNCVNCDDVDALNEMMDSAVDVTYNEFVSKVGLPAIFDSGIGYGYYWTPAQAIAGGVDYNEVARNRPLTLKKDWHVSYHRSTYQGKPCYFMVHSAIEYVFVKT